MLKYVAMNMAYALVMLLRGKYFLMKVANFLLFFKTSGNNKRYAGDLGSTPRSSTARLITSPLLKSPHPVIFICHGLGGVILKQVGCDLVNRRCWAWADENV